MTGLSRLARIPHVPIEERLRLFQSKPFRFCITTVSDWLVWRVVIQNVFTCLVRTDT